VAISPLFDSHVDARFLLGECKGAITTRLATKTEYPQLRAALNAWPSGTAGTPSDEQARSLAGLLAQCSDDELAKLAYAVAARLDKLCYRDFAASPQFRALTPLAGHSAADSSQPDHPHSAQFDFVASAVNAVTSAIRPPHLLTRSNSFTRGLAKKGSPSDPQLDAGCVDGAPAVAAPTPRRNTCDAPHAAAPSDETTSTAQSSTAAKGKKSGGEVSDYLSGVTYLQSIKIKDDELGQGSARCHQMLSVNEDRFIRMGRNPALRTRLLRHNGRQLSRIYPRGTRFSSTNMAATDFCDALQMGCQVGSTAASRHVEHSTRTLTLVRARRRAR
jgi:hypothetical protein